MKFSVVSRTAGAILGLWLSGAGAAWAGGGGADLGTLQALLSNTQGTGLCDGSGGNPPLTFFGLSISPCPIPPTVTQSALEVAALGNSLFGMLLQQNNIVPNGSRVYAGN